MININKYKFPCYSVITTMFYKWQLPHFTSNTPNNCKIIGNKGMFSHKRFQDKIRLKHLTFINKAI